MIKGFIFDLDNTLIDDDKGWEKALRQTCEYISGNYNIGHTKEEIYKAYKKISDYEWNNYSSYLADFISRQEKREYVWRKTLEYMDCYSNESQVKDITEAFSEFRENNVIAYDYAQQLLEKIEQMGLKAIVCTDGEETLQKMKCSRANMDRLIDKIISAADLGCPKPEKKVFDKCVEYLGIDADTLMYIGDDEVKDIMGAHNAGMQAMLVNGKDGVALKDIYENLEEIVRTGKLKISKGGDYDS
ncbi:MAG: HAD-IA family hydrolase [Lachnospiraceae bacterium]|nr:HAD-IA family hydrolase [Lachnospiraceae bacterium]